MAGGRPQSKRSFSIIPCFVFVEGFFCYDSTYAKPYPGPEAASRAPPALIYALVTAGPTLTEDPALILPTDPAGGAGACLFPCTALSHPHHRGEHHRVWGLLPLQPPTAEAGPLPGGLLLRPLHHDHLRQCGAGGDRQPDAALPVGVPPQLHGPGLPTTLARQARARPLRHRPGCLCRQPQPRGRCAPCLPLQGCRSLRLCGHLHSDVRDSRVPREGLPPGQALALPGPAVPRLPGGRGPCGRVPQPLVRRVGGLPDRRCHRNLSGHLCRTQLPEPAALWPKALPLGGPGPSPHHGKPPRKEPEACRPHSTPARLTPSKSQNCARRGHLIPSCVSSRAPAMCSSPRVPRPRLRSEPTPLPLPLPLPAPTPSQGPSPSSPGPGGPGGGGGRGRKLLLPTPLLRDLYTLSGLYPSPFHRDNFSPYLFASRDHLL
ncbi:phospholipid phosphatase-related protein type 2 isoform X3 [Ailuropoda melanoleuca]|uniref:phospholipid phosphatase-related protein type 2 isoform X3 n=1 Tax=Ailuropoda melanoleuca TaxID=9646 RepID=UPI001494C9B3|nr:phospholipid phosphatase-related protein type 2 isoform X3 [Ailuropoda melanoleuca]